MTPERELELLRAETKRQIRERGISLDGRMLREIGQRVEAINKSGDLEVPTTVIEVLEIYYEMLKDLTATRLENIKDMIEAEKSEPSKTPRAVQNGSRPPFSSSGGTALATKPPLTGPCGVGPS